ncbi:hypothetical protein HBI81_082550 [Parastagonospora nodorum]|nr:hypothetical protein HBI03_120900 [Parastagonospora nodorum]KAH4281421.1 hypothetical protein HBI04_038270 [Parastagonospora nodorum]KAH4611008.1 hypothetical protein HBH82_038070 [Parastagonospora nodorum]KAH4693808.1 hypothetical protein HBH78_074050 [Parastagonospora nodorum]KAH4700521.1 hypothetical protein HBH67_144750 [Parastagonospora nodorum]
MAPKNTDPARAAESNLGYLLGVTAAFHAVALIFVAMRTYARIVVVKAFGRDDALMLAATACVFLGGMVTYILAGQHGLGRHTDTLENKDHYEYLKLTFIQAIVSSIGGMAFLKLSVGFSLLRLSPPPLYTRMLWTLIGFVCLYTIVSWGEWAAVCKPISGFWNKDLRAKCLPVKLHKGFALMNTSCNILTDICFASLPVPIILGLQMRQKTRIYLIFILSLGYIAVAMGVVKTVVQNTKRGDPDQSFTNDIQFWGFLQVNTGIIAACAPSLKPLLGGVLRLTSTQQSKGPSNYGTGTNGQSNKSKRQSRIRVSTRASNNGWVRTDSDIELDEAASFNSQTKITSKRDAE